MVKLVAEVVLLQLDHKLVQGSVWGTFLKELNNPSFLLKMINPTLNLVNFSKVEAILKNPEMNRESVAKVS